MQMQLRAPISDARPTTVCRQGPAANSQRLSLAVPRTASRHSLSLSRADEHAIYAERVPGTTNFAAVSTSRSTVLCGHGLAQPMEVRSRPWSFLDCVPARSLVILRRLPCLTSASDLMLCMNAPPAAACCPGSGSRLFSCGCKTSAIISRVLTLNRTAHPPPPPALTRR